MFRQQTVRKVFVKLELLLFPFSRRYPLSYVYAGRYIMSSGVLGYQNEMGFWWSGLASSDRYAYYFRMSGSEADPLYPDGKLFVFPLR
ncbi:hypothetical protein IK112_02785 [Candidatus Saccharibacteria bacterium]|nr:hypothetical protein [Candidatus Saccharibacteria bacterium]